MRVLIPPPRRTSVPLASACLALLVALTPSQALGETGISLDWRAPAECPKADQVMAKVERLLGSRTARPPAPIEVVASVSRDGSAFRVRIEARRAETQVRELKGASCAAVANATALILAMMIDPSVASAAAEKAPPEPPETAAPAAPAEANPGPAPPAAPAEAPPSNSPVEPTNPPQSAPSGTRSPPAALPRPPMPTQLSAPPPAQPERPPSIDPTPVSSGLLAWVGADAGSLPGIGAGFGVAGLARYGAQHFELGAGVWPRRTAEIPERPSVGGNIGLFAITAGTCRALLQQPIELSPCAALELGVMHATGFGVASTEYVSVFWAALRGGGALTFRPAKHLGLHLRIDAVIPLTAPRFLIGRVGEVHQPSPGGRGAVGISYDL